MFGRCYDDGFVVNINSSSSTDALRTNESTLLPELSVVIITLNEEKNIERCLRSCKGVGEVVIYDSGSKDRTLELAQDIARLELTGTDLKLAQGPWHGFGATKKHAASLARNTWILSLDADEVITPELLTEIKDRWSSLNPKAGYNVPRRSRFLGRWITHGGWYPDRQLRLFNKQFSNWDDEKIHEKVFAEQIEKLESEILHFVFRDLAHQVDTNNRYSSLQAERLFERGKNFNWFHFFTKPTVKFIECYIWKLGFLDGWAGFVIAKNAAHSVFMKWAKLHELELKAEHSTDVTQTKIPVGRQ